MLNCLYFVVLVILLDRRRVAVQGYPYGPPLTQVICKSISPLEHISETRNSSTDLKFEISTERNWFRLEEAINISIGSKDHPTFRGIMIQVVDVFEQAAGRFAPPSDDSGFKILPCHDILNNFSENSTISHSNAKDKPATTFQWTPNFSICNGLEYHIRATIVKQFKIFQTGIYKSIKCFPRHANLNGEILVSDVEGKSQDQCKVNNRTSVPTNKYNNNFENCDLGGWYNTGWRCNRNKTTTHNTGPQSAGEGLYYMYFETSYPRRPGDQIFLETSQDLRGCFCLKFKHNHNVDNNKGHTLTVKAGSDYAVHYKVTKKFTGWKNISLQFNEQDFVKITIEGRRGGNIKGDMAIDDIKIVAGSCS